MDRATHTVRLEGYNLHIAGAEDSNRGNLVIGNGHTYSKCTNCLVAGFENEGEGRANAVFGNKNFVSGHFNSVNGGQQNHGGGFASSITGGFQNRVDGEYTHVSGGIQNEAHGKASYVGGGSMNRVHPSASFAAIPGGVSRSANEQDEFIFPTR